MDIKKIVNKFNPRSAAEAEEEFIEIQPEAEDRRINVKIDTLKDYSDTERVQTMVREGNVVFLKIKDIRQRDITELKRCVERLKKTCLAMNGDIVGVDEDFLVITPDFAKVYRGKAA